MRKKIAYKIISFVDTIQSFFKFIESVTSYPLDNFTYWQSEIASHIKITVEDSENPDKLTKLESDNRYGILNYIGILTRFHDIGKIMGKNQHENTSSQLMLENPAINRCLRKMIESGSIKDSSEFGRTDLDYKVALFALIVKYHTLMTTGLTGEYSMRALEEIKEEIELINKRFGIDAFNHFLEGLYFLSYFDRGSKMKYDSNWADRLRDFRKLCENYKESKPNFDFADRIARMILFQVPSASIADIDRLAQILRENGIINFPLLARVMKYGYAAALMEKIASKTYNDKNRLKEFLHRNEQDFQFNMGLITFFRSVEDIIREYGIDPEKVSFLFKNWDNSTLTQDANSFLDGKFEIEVNDSKIIIKKKK